MPDYILYPIFVIAVVIILGAIISLTLEMFGD